MRNDESVFKVPCSKRKNKKRFESKQIKKMTLKEKGQEKQSDTVNKSPLMHPFRMVRRIMGIVMSTFWK